MAGIRSGVARVPSNIHSDPILVGGCPSTGTTLLRAILDSHSRIACGPEVGIFDREIIYREKFSFFRTLIQAGEEIRKLRFRVKGNNNKEINLLACVLNASSRFPAATNFGSGEGMGLRNYVDDWALVVALSNMAESYEAFFDGIFGEYARRQGKARWAEKTPDNVYQFELCLQQFPKFRLVHIIRHPLDTVASQVNRPFHPIPFSIALPRYSEAIYQAVHCRGHERYHEIRYEDLVTEPETVLRGLMEFIGEEFEPGVLSFYSKKRTGTRGYGEKPLTVQSIGRWKRDLSPEQQETAKDYFGKHRIAEWAGYEL